MKKTLAALAILAAFAAPAHAVTFVGFTPDVFLDAGTSFNIHTTA